MVIFSADITPVFSATRSFRNHSDLLFSRNISYYYESVLKTVVLLNIFAETVIFFYFLGFFGWTESSKEQHFFEEIFCNIINVLIILMQNKSVNLVLLPKYFFKW